jgi:hypothetical protein
MKAKPEQKQALEEMQSDLIDRMLTEALTIKESTY